MNCPTCGTRCRVIGTTTLYYEPVSEAERTADQELHTVRELQDEVDRLKLWQAGAMQHGVRLASAYRVLRREMDADDLGEGISRRPPLFSVRQSMGFFGEVWQEPDTEAERRCIP